MAFNKLTQLILVGVLLFYSVNSQSEKITAKERELIQKLRSHARNILYKDYFSTDEYLVRFLRVSDNDLSTAKEKLEKTIAWRKENKMDTILIEDFSDIENEYPFYLDGVDKQGRPILIGKAGLTDLRRLSLTGKIDKVFRLGEASLELAEGILREIHLEKNITNTVGQLTWIADHSGFNLRQHGCIQCTRFFPHLYSTYEKYYPERMYRLFSINAPNIFLPTLELAKTVLSSKTLKRVSAYGRNPDEWKAVLLNQIAEDQLPTAYGGTKTNVKFKSLSQHIKTNPYAKRAVDRIKAKN